MKPVTKKELTEKYRIAIYGLRCLVSSADDLLVHEIVDETLELLGEPKEGPGNTLEG